MPNPTPTDPVLDATLELADYFAVGYAEADAGRETDAEDLGVIYESLRAAREYTLIEEENE